MCGALIVLFAIAWRAWQPYLCIFQSQQRIAELQRELRAQQVQEKELRYRLATAATPAGVERVAVATGLGPPETVALRPRWEPEPNPPSRRGPYASTLRWAEHWWQQRLGEVHRPPGMDDNAEPATRSLTLR